MSSSGQLPRVLGFTTATAIVVGTVIGSGVFKKASAVSTNVPEAGPALLAWIFVGVLTVLGALTLAEVAVIVGKAGGNYAILRDAYGRWAGFLWGWVEFWIIRSGSIAALSTIFTESLHDILRQLHPQGPDIDVLSPWARTAVTAITIAILAIVNARGTKLGASLQLVVTTVKVLSLLLIALLPVIALAIASSPEAKPKAERLNPAWPSTAKQLLAESDANGDGNLQETETPAWLDKQRFTSADANKDGTLSADELKKFDWRELAYWIAFGGALVGVFWAYHGWMNIAPVAEEIKNPQRNIPAALLVGVGIVMLLYVTVNFAYYLIIPGNEIKSLSTRTVAGEYSFRILGSVGLLFASTAIMISVFGSLNGNLLVGPRLLYAMGLDGLAPRWLSRLHPIYATPALATAVLAGWAILLVIVVGVLTTNRLPTINPGEWASWVINPNLPAGKAPFDVITDFAMFGAISFETLAVASIFVFRRRFPKHEVALPYRCPMFPILPAIYVMALAAVLVNMFWSQRIEAMTGVGFILVGAAIYSAFLRSKRPSING